MALYRRIFPHREKGRGGRWSFRSCRSHKKDYNFTSPEVLTSFKSWQAPEYDRNQIRLLVFNEGDLKGRKLLFDSKAIKKNELKLEPSPCKGNNYRFGCPFGSKNNLSSASTHPETSGSPGPTGDNNKYTFLRPSSDVKLLGEMMYGSVAMSYQGSTVKVHTIKSPAELMLSQVFVLRPKENIDQDKDNISLAPVDMMVQRHTPSESIAHSIPVAVPPASPYSSLDEDSGLASSSSSFLTPFPSPGSSVSSTQSNSFQRRWMRNKVTSMEHGVRRKSSETLLNVDEPMNRKRHPKIGVGVVVSLFDETELDKRRHFQTFFFSHFTLFEGHFLRMSLAVEKALTYQRRMFITPIMEALEEFRSSVYSLYCAPRIQRPIWLNMMTYQMQRGHLCEHLMHELRTELEIHNSKQTNFFFSRLLTAVLMHHLAWVPTVMPAEAAPSRAYLDKHSSTQLDTLAKSHPYNPLWAQLGDMFGAIGFPCKVTKTIIVGRRADIVCRLLYILSYFIRCSEVHEIPEQREKIYMDYEPHFELRSLGIDMVHETVTESAAIDSNGGAGDAVPKPEGLKGLCDSADSGLESSGERLIEAGEVNENFAVSSSEEGIQSLASTQVGCLYSGHERSATNSQVSSSSALNKMTELGSDDSSEESLKTPTLEVCGTKVIGQDGTDLVDNVTRSLFSDLSVTRDRPSSGGLYPDLETILSGNADGFAQDIDGGRSAVQPSPPEGLIPVQPKDVKLASPQRECVAAVGRSAPTSFQNREVVRTAALYPKTSDDLFLDSKVEYSNSVGRINLQVDESTRHGHLHSFTKTTGEGLVQFESGPGHDRSSNTPPTAPPKTENQSLNIQTLPSGAQEPTEMLTLTPSAPATVRDSSVNALSTGDSLADTWESSSPSTRRHKRFPLTSPLALAHQEAVRAKESNIRNSVGDYIKETSTGNMPRGQQTAQIGSSAGCTHPDAADQSESPIRRLVSRTLDNVGIECPADRVQQTSTSKISHINGDTQKEVKDQPESTIAKLVSGAAVDTVSQQTATGGCQTTPHPIRCVSQEAGDRLEFPLGHLIAGTHSAVDPRGQQRTPVGRQTSLEKGRTYKRCFSAGSSVSSGYSDMTLMDHEELPMAFSEPVTPETVSGETYVDNFGRSLLGGYSQTYVPDMALHGVPALDRRQVLSDLVLASQNSVLDEAISEAVCIVADTDNCTVELLSSERTVTSMDKPLSLEVSVAECVNNLLESVHQMCHLRMPSDFCLMHLEDQLQEIYFKSTALAAYLEQNPKAGPKELTAILGFEPSNLPLLLSVLSVHSPKVIKNVLRETYEKR